MKKTILACLIAAHSFGLQAEVQNDHFELDSCSLRAVFEVANELDAYSGPNEPLWILKNLSSVHIAENQYNYRVTLELVWDGDDSTYAKVETIISVFAAKSGQCPLPVTTFPIISGAKAPQSKCVTGPKANLDLINCNEDLFPFRAALKLSDFFTFPAQLTANQTVRLIDEAKQQIFSHMNTFNFNNRGEWVIHQAKMGNLNYRDPYNGEEDKDEQRIIVEWIDHDDDSYAIHFTEDFKFISTEYLN